jgi:hypothetical protein
MKMHGLHCYFPFIVIVGDSAPWLKYYHPVGWHLCWYLLIPCFSGIDAYHHVFHEAFLWRKNIGWEISNGYLKNVFKNFGKVGLSRVKVFRNDFWKMRRMMARSWSKVWFKVTLVVLCSRSEQLTRSSTLPWSGSS